jgi:hypothetical protein
MSLMCACDKFKDDGYNVKKNTNKNYNLYERIDSLPYDLIKILNDEWGIIKWNNIYININKIKIPRDISNLFKKDYISRGNFIATVKYRQNGSIEKRLKNRRDPFRFYSWLYFPNGDMLYRQDENLESRQCILIKLSKR